MTYGSVPGHFIYQLWLLSWTLLQQNWCRR